MANDTSNEFLTSPDNNLRPYASGMLRHNETLSTIIVYTDVSSEFQQTEEIDINYLDEFNTPVIGIDGPNKEAPSYSNTPDDIGGQPALLDMNNDNSFDYYGVFNNFSLTNVNESSEQIVKIQLNFGSDWNAFFFGEKPRIYQFSGHFLDSQDYPFYQEFMTAYDKYMSGRKAIENKLKTVISYDGRIVDGYILNIMTQHSAADQLIKPFQFTVLVKESYWVRNNYSENGYGLNKFNNSSRMGRYINDGSIGQTSSVRTYKTPPGAI